VHFSLKYLFNQMIEIVELEQQQKVNEANNSTKTKKKHV